VSACHFAASKVQWTVDGYPADCVIGWARKGFHRDQLFVSPNIWMHCLNYLFAPCSRKVLQLDSLRFKDNNAVMASRQWLSIARLQAHLRILLSGCSTAELVRQTFNGTQLPAFQLPAVELNTVADDDRCLTHARRRLFANNAFQGTLPDAWSALVNLKEL
jgi:hypothetical protein